MANNYFKKRSSYSILQQRIALLTAYKDGKIKMSNRNELIWEGYLCPTPLSKRYHVLVYYQVNRRPKVIVCGDELEKLDAKDFPHHFHIDTNKKAVQICLHLAHEFNSQKLLADTIIPWTIEWLYYYELWLATGEWHGGGKHNDSVKTDNIINE